MVERNFSGFSLPILVVRTAPASCPFRRIPALCHSLLRDAPQNVFDRVGEGGEAHDDEQVSKRSTQESMVTIDLLYVGRVGRTCGQMPV